MNVGSSLVANGQAAVLGQPRERPLNYPAMPTEPVVALDPFPSDPALDAPPPEELPAAGDVIALIGMDFLRSLPPPSTRGADRWDGRDQPLEEHRVMPVCPTQEGGEGNPSSVDHNMALRARFAFIRWIRASFIAPFFAGTLAESSEARDQSILSASPRRSSSA